MSYAFDHVETLSKRDSEAPRMASTNFSASARPMQIRSAA